MKRDKKISDKDRKMKKNLKVNLDENSEEGLEENSTENEKKRSIVLPVIILIVGFAVGAFFYTNKSDGANVINKYYDFLRNKEYDKMYDLVDTSLSKDEFTSRVKNIYEGIEIQDIKISIIGNTYIENQNILNESNNLNNNENNNTLTIERNGDNSVNQVIQENQTEQLASVTYNVNAKCVAGELKFTRTSEIIKKDGKVKIKWSSEDIYPDLQDNEKIRVRSVDAKRGAILDRNGYSLAKDSEAYLAKLVVDKVDSTTDYNNLSKLTGVDVNTLKSEVNKKKADKNSQNGGNNNIKNEANNNANNDNQKENQGDSTSDGYIKLKKFSKDDQDLKNKLLKIKGVLIVDTKTREYPRGEAFSALIGYVQDNDGKAGVEKQFNDRLKAKDGCEIYIEDSNGKIKKTIAKTNPEDGEDIKLTIDAMTQEKIYSKFKDDKSTAVNINYKTGEILALVSTPSYDNNLFSLGMTADEWNKLQNDEKAPMYPRFLATYVPGSSIKPIVAAIGLETNSLKPDDDFGNYGLKWQKDKKWKDFYITTLNENRGENTTNNLRNALIYSDNIYFAQAALKIGKENLCNGFNKFGFNENVDFIQNIQTSEYGEISNEKDLASTGYGQAKLLVNPILMASIYSCFANDGNMIKPYIEFEKNDKNKVKIYKSNVINSENANIIEDDLIQVVKDGTGKDANIAGKTIAGKTGTAEIKASKNDKTGTEIGWFDAFDEDGNLIISMVENVENRGGSNYVVKKVAQIFDTMVK